MANIFGIIGFLLIVPSLIMGAGYLIYFIIMLIKGIIKELKQDLFDGLLLINLAMCTVGMFLLTISLCL